MSVIADARSGLVGALRSVGGLRVYPDPSATVDPPAAIVSLPDLRWEAPCPGPTNAVFEIALVVKLDDRAIENLQELVLQASAAIDQLESAIVTQARVGAWNDQLPAYLIEVEVAL